VIVVPYVHCVYCLLGVLCNLYGCLNVSLCICLVFGLFHPFCFLTVDVLFFDRDNLAALFSNIPTGFVLALAVLVELLRCASLRREKQSSGDCKISRRLQ